ncbi:DNA cytosine methyltransferase [Thiomicrolovo sp. ZZH C-3]
MKVYTSAIGTENEKRIFLESNRLNDTEFLPGAAITLSLTPKRLVIRQTVLGHRIVSQRKGKPVLDIQNKALSEAFEGVENVCIKIYADRIEIEPLTEEQLQKKALAKATNPLTFIDLFAGGGTLTESFKLSGFKPVGAVEIVDAYLGNYEKNNPGVFTYNTRIQDADWSLLPDADIVMGGAPCDKYCNAGKAKAVDTGEAVCEAGDTGYLAYYFLEAVRAIRPGIAVIEEVEGFAKSAIVDVVKNVLKAMQYHVTEAIFYAYDMGGMTKRKRYCLIGSMGKPVEIPTSAAASTKSIRDILEVPYDEREWHTAETNKSIANFLRREAENKQKDAKRNFGIGRVYIDDRVAPTVTKHYTKAQMSQPILYDPDRDAFSFFLPVELARLNGLPPSYQLPESKTLASEIIGQGVDIPSWTAVADAIKQTHNDAQCSMEYWGN